MSSPEAAAIAAIFKRSLPIIRERIELLERAAEQLSETRTLEPELRAEAIDIAHKLAGSLGMFGYDKATEISRAIEIDLEAPGLPQPERLQKHVTGLRASLGTALEE